MKMSYEEEVIFINKFGVKFRKCTRTECVWNAKCNELSNGGIMSGKIVIPRFDERVCNCPYDNSIALHEAAKVRCYPLEGIQKEKKEEVLANFKI